ncbi:hypothetical protein [Acanthopleuribacter pedis]|uniref:Uncharacterized protein n=1 Tax=Acanthopleuribacter pedis TaxID=442870 RepID=A0A8J7Q0V2_9BACT|nr:hypothetical protein [Acanthopleuribacter pedis]MBO1318337.1 hypothetical protein [Acanthopleuribacter pedis]
MDVSIVSMVTGPISLMAALAVVLYWFYLTKTKEKINLISTASEKERGILIQQTMDDVYIDTNKMSGEQLHDLAIKKMETRERKHRRVIRAALLVFVVFSSVTAFSFFFGQNIKKNNSFKMNPAVVEKKSEQKNAIYASRKSKVFHSSFDCVYGKMISQKNKIEGQAAREGRTLHSGCPKLHF